MNTNANGKDDWLSKLAPPVGCLSELEIAERCARPQDGWDMSHLATCATCATRMRAQEALHAAAAYEPVPAALLAPPRRAARPWLPMLGACLAMGLAGLLILPHGVPPVDPAATEVWTQKGSLGVYATVLRQDAVLADNEPLASLTPLRPADRLRLRIAGGVAVVTVRSWEGGAWQELYQGPVDAEGWLPGSITLTDTGATRLRVQVCAQLNVPKSCSEQTFDL